MLKQYKHKYKKKMSWDEELVYFAVKAVGGVALFLIFAIGVDIYRFL